MQMCNSYLVEINFIKSNKTNGAAEKKQSDHNTSSYILLDIYAIKVIVFWVLSHNLPENRCKSCFIINYFV